MLKWSDVAYWKYSNFKNISLIFGIGYGFCFNYLFRFLDSLRKLTWFDLGLGCENDGLPILNNLLPQLLIIGLNFQPPFFTFTHVTSLLGIFASIFSLHYLLTQSLLDLVYRFQVFHSTTLRISVIMLSIHYVVSLLNVDTEFP